MNFHSVLNHRLRRLDSQFGADPHLSQGATAIVATANDPLNARAAPGSGSPLVGSIPKGETVVVLSAGEPGAGASAWYHVAHSGGEGWVSGDYLHPEHSAAPPPGAASASISTPLGTVTGTASVPSATISTPVGNITGGPSVSPNLQPIAPPPPAVSLPTPPRAETTPKKPAAPAPKPAQKTSGGFMHYAGWGLGMGALVAIAYGYKKGAHKKAHGLYTKHFGK